MEIGQWHEARVKAAEALLGAAGAAPFTTPVPACPAWSVGDLVYHVGEVLSFWTTVVRDEIDEPETIEMPVRPPDADLLTWFASVADEADRVLRTSDPAAYCWTWSEQHDVAFVIRRMAQETAVHAWDAASPGGDPPPIPGALASDGIDEFLSHFTSWRRADALDLGGTVHLHCTDVSGEWLVTQRGAALEFTREHAKGSCAIRGTANDLLLALWRRRPLDSVEVIGDADVAARFVAWTSLD